MSFDESAAERWYQNRQSRQRTTSTTNPTERLRNSSRSMFFDRKDYTGGPLREGVSDRRSEWMGGGMGGRMGEDWRNIAPNTVQRQGSGLDPISAAVVNRFKQRSQKKQMAKRGFNVSTEPETEEGVVEPAAEPAAEAVVVEPTITKPKRTMTPEQREKANARRRALTAEAEYGGRALERVRQRGA